MWYKVTELKSKGLRCVQIAHELGLHRHTVEKYVRMSLEEFQASQAYERDFKYKLDIFEEEVKNELIRAPYLSNRQVHDHLREHHADFPEVSEKTVFNLVMRVRDKYRIPKTYEENFHDECKHYNKSLDYEGIVFFLVAIGGKFAHASSNCHLVGGHIQIYDLTSEKTKNEILESAFWSLAFI